MDELLDEFEESWKPDHAGPSATRQFLALRYPEMIDNWQVLAGLARIDIELAWQNWDRMLKNTPNLSAACAIEQFQALPRLESYIDLLGEPSCHMPVWRELVIHEAAARSNWGDNPSPERYRQSWNIDIPLDLRREPGRIQVVYTSRYDDRGSSQSRRPLNVSLRGKITVGRQRSSDRSDWACTENAEGTRIVITHRMDTSISRNQLVVQLLNSNRVWLHNGQSNTNHFSVSGSVLAAGQSQVISLPFIINLGSVRLLFENSVAD